MVLVQSSFITNTVANSALWRHFWLTIAWRNTRARSHDAREQKVGSLESSRWNARGGLAQRRADAFHRVYIYPWSGSMSPSRAFSPSRLPLSIYLSSLTSFLLGKSLSLSLSLFITVWKLCRRLRSLLVSRALVISAAFHFPLGAFPTTFLRFFSVSFHLFSVSSSPRSWSSARENTQDRNESFRKSETGILRLLFFFSFFFLFVLGEQTVRR